MPWEVVGTCVHKIGEPDPIPGGCHDTAAEAEAHVRALYANSNKESSGQPSDYLVVDDPEMPTTWHLRVRQGGKPDHTLMGAAWAALHEGYRGNQYEGPDKGTALKKLVALYESEGLPTSGSKNKEFFPGTLAVYKAANGNYRWVLCSSNAYEDRDGEIVSQKSLDADVARADRDGDYGNLRWWHLKSDLGPCDFNMMYGRVLVESGTFHDWRVAQRVKDKAPTLEVSIGFTYPVDEPDAEGVFHNIHRFERSILPRGFASNPFTSVHLINKESGMPTQEEKEKAFAEFMQVDLATGQKMLQAAVLAEKSATEANARTKAKKDDAEKVPADDAPNGTDAEADKPFPKDQAEDDADPTKKDEKGMVKKKDFDPLVAAIVTRLDQLAADLHILTSAQAEKATRDAGELAAIKQLAEKANDGVLELKGELPRRLGDPLAAYRPSLHGQTPTEDKVKQVTPEHDPWAKHMNALLPTNPLVPPGN